MPIVKAQIFPMFPAFPMGTLGNPITIGQCYKIYILGPGGWLGICKMLQCTQQMFSGL